MFALCVCVKRGILKEQTLTSGAVMWETTDILAHTKKTLVGKTKKNLKAWS